MYHLSVLNMNFDDFFKNENNLTTFLAVLELLIVSHDLLRGFFAIRHGSVDAEHFHLCFDIVTMMSVRLFVVFYHSESTSYEETQQIV